MCLVTECCISGQDDTWHAHLVYEHDDGEGDWVAVSDLTEEGEGGYYTEVR
jgi:hypothetical protein